MTIPNWVVPGFTLVYTTAFGAAIQQSAVTGTWILDALTVSPGSVYGGILRAKHWQYRIPGRTVHVCTWKRGRIWISVLG